jgi:hypothetical protein
MRCTSRRLVWCPKHLTVWCVMGTCRGIEMFHEGCEVMLAPKEGVGEQELVHRAVVSWFEGPNRNEVRECAEG